MTENRRAHSSQAAAVTCQVEQAPRPDGAEADRKCLWVNTLGDWSRQIDTVVPRKYRMNPISAHFRDPSRTCQGPPARTPARGFMTRSHELKWMVAVWGRAAIRLRFGRFTDRDFPSSSPPRCRALESYAGGGLPAFALRSTPGRSPPAEAGGRSGKIRAARRRGRVALSGVSGHNAGLCRDAVARPGRRGKGTAR